VSISAASFGIDMSVKFENPNGFQCKSALHIENSDIDGSMAGTTFSGFDTAMSVEDSSMTIDGASFTQNRRAIAAKDSRLRIKNVRID
jgi:hypothetical protein